MRIIHSTAVLGLAMVLSVPALQAQTNTEQTTQTKDQLKRDQKASKAQSEADKKQREALNTHEQKDADKAQDSADRKAAEANH